MRQDYRAQTGELAKNRDVPSYKVNSHLLAHAVPYM